MEKKNVDIDYTDFDTNILMQDKNGNYYRLRIEQDNLEDNPRNWDNLGYMVCWHRDYALGDRHNFESPEDFWHEMIRKHIKTETLFDYALSGTGSVKLEKNSDEDGEEGFELCYWGYTAFIREGQKPSWCFDKFYDTDNIEDLKSGWYVEDDIIDNLSISDCQKLLKDIVFYLPLYLYDHSGITMNTGGFSCSWDSGQMGWIYATKEDIQKEYGAFTEENLQKAYQCLEGEVETYAQFLEGDVYWYRLEKFLGGTVGTERVAPEDALEDDYFWDIEDSCGGFYGSDVNENGMADSWGDMERVA